MEDDMCRNLCKYWFISIHLLNQLVLFKIILELTIILLAWNFFDISDY